MGKTVFIVEDDQDICRNLKELLELEGYSVVAAENGRIALDLLEEAKDLPSVILLDLMMPVMDGNQFRSVQEMDPRLAPIPVVLMTADAHIEEKRMKLGAQGFLRKPLDADILMSILERYCAGSGTNSPIPISSA